MIDRWIEKAASSTDVPVRVLEGKEVESLVGDITAKFAPHADQFHMLWEAFDDDVSFRRDDGWSLICDYPEPAPLLLIKEGEIYSGYAFLSGRDCKTVLAECPGFEFYVTNESADFVLCHNHHDYVIGVGECRGWLLSLNASDEAIGDGS